MNNTYKENMWETEDGEWIKISDMETSHIVNVINLLKRNPDFYDECDESPDYYLHPELLIQKIEELQAELNKRNKQLIDKFEEVF